MLQDCFVGSTDYATTNPPPQLALHRTRGNILVAWWLEPYKLAAALPGDLADSHLGKFVSPRVMPLQPAKQQVKSAFLASTLQKYFPSYGVHRTTCPEIGIRAQMDSLVRSPWGQSAFSPEAEQGLYREASRSAAAEQIDHSVTAASQRSNKGREIRSTRLNSAGAFHLPNKPKVKPQLAVRARELRDGDTVRKSFGVFSQAAVFQ